jgi:RNA 3'-terminal phosphate cyclase
MTHPETEDVLAGGVLVLLECFEDAAGFADKDSATLSVTGLTADHGAITPDYLRTMGIRLLRGWDFTEADQLESPGVVVVNESFVRRFFPDQS